RPASDSVDSALDCVWPTVLGTLTCWGWRATVSVTVVPRPTWLPDPGSWLSTLPGVSVLESCCTIATFSPTLANSAAAESWLWPADAVSDTVDPSSALVLGWGSWRRILSRGCGETTVVTWTLKPSFSRIAFPTTSCVPTTPGTFTLFAESGPSRRNTKANAASTASTAAIHG